MKFSVNQKDLQESLSFCQNVIERRSTLPILSNVLLEASGNRTQAAPSRQVTPPPSVRAPGPAAAGAGDDEKVKKEDESIKVEQNAKQKKDKSTVKKGLSALGAAPAVNTPVVTPPAGINTP